MTDSFSLPKGVALRHNKGGVPIMRIHFSADPERDPAINPEWKKKARKKYSSQGAWDREQEIRATAGGGELVFAEVLRTYAHKIIISDPDWKPSPNWKPLGGFDHGKTNPTAALVARVDHDGTIYLCGEYYMNQLGPREHAKNLRDLPGFYESAEVWSDPSIFTKNQAQEKGSFKSVAQLYEEAGVVNLVPAKNAILLGIERILDHWYDLENNEPTLKIVCRPTYDRMAMGLSPNDCPNLLWEMMRSRREKLTAVQLMNRNPSEKLVDKDDHALDAARYLIQALPEPTRRPRQDVIREKTKDMNDINRVIQTFKLEKEMRDEEEAPTFSRGGGTAARRGWKPTKGGGATPPFGRRRY